MKSDAIKEGVEHAPHRALLYAGGISDKNIKGVVKPVTEKPK